MQDVLPAQTLAESRVQILEAQTQHYQVLCMMQLSSLQNKLFLLIHHAINFNWTVGSITVLYCNSICNETFHTSSRTTLFLHLCSISSIPNLGNPCGLFCLTYNQLWLWLCPQRLQNAQENLEKMELSLPAARERILVLILGIFWKGLA